MTTWTALTTLNGKEPAEALGLAMERLQPEPTGIGVFEVEDDSGIWEVGEYFIEKPDEAGLALLAAMHGAKEAWLGGMLPGEQDRLWLLAGPLYLEPGLSSM